MRREVLAAVGRLHGAGVVHGDLRSDDILVDASDPVLPTPSSSPRCRYPVLPTPSSSARCRSLSQLLLSPPGLQILEGDCYLVASASIGDCGAAGLSRSRHEVVAVTSLQTILAAGSWQSAGRTPCTQGAPKVTLVDLGRATPGASPQECEDEMRSLRGGLEDIVSRLLLRMRRVVAGPCAEVTRPATSRGAQFDIRISGRGGRRALARISIRPLPAVAPTTVIDILGDNAKLRPAFWAHTAGYAAACATFAFLSSVGVHSCLCVCGCCYCNCAIIFSAFTTSAALGASTGGVKTLLPALAQRVAEWQVAE